MTKAIARLSLNDHLEHGIDIAAVSNNGHSCFSNAATVLETHHSSGTTIVAIGGNYGTVLGHYPSHEHHEPQDKLAIVKALAEQSGYRLVKKAKSND